MNEALTTVRRKFPTLAGREQVPGPSEWDSFACAVRPLHSLRTLPVTANSGWPLHQGQGAKIQVTAPVPRSPLTGERQATPSTLRATEKPAPSSQEHVRVACGQGQGRTGEAMSQPSPGVCAEFGVGGSRPGKQLLRTKLC